MNKATQTPLTAPKGIISYLLNSVSFKALLFTGLLVTSAHAQTVIYESDFSSDTIGGQPSGWLQNSIVAEDPLSIETKVMATLGGTTRTTYTYHQEGGTVTNAGGFQLSLSVYIADAGESWNTNHYIQQGNLSNASFFTTGYGFRLSPTTVNIQVTSGSGSSTNTGSSTTLVSDTVPDGALLENAWNDILFTWKGNGELSISLNGTELLNTIDTTYSPSYRTLRFNSFMNNTTDVQGQQLFYKDIAISSIPESSSVALLVAMVALGLCFWSKRSR